MHVAKRMITPNGKLDKRTVSAMIMVEIAIFAAVWVTSPFVFLPKPQDVLSAMGDLWQQGLALELITSLTLNFQALLVASLLSLVMAYLGTVPLFRPAIQMIGKLRFLSMVGLTFFFTLMTNSGHQLKLSLLVFSVSVFFVTGMVDVINSVPKEKYDLCRVLHMGPWRTLYEAVILGQFDKAFDVLRQNAAIGWMMLSMIEGMSRSEGGIGAMLMTQNKYFHLSEIMAIQIIILVLGLLQDFVLGWLKSLVCPYANLVLENNK
jgi:NitT/TauT family transport system permease protein